MGLKRGIYKKRVRGHTGRKIKCHETHEKKRLGGGR